MLKPSRRIWVVASKELRDVRRDLKSLQVLFFLPLFMVGSFVAMCLFTLSMSKHSQLNIEQPVELVVKGAEHFPELIHALKENAIKITADSPAHTSGDEVPYSLEIPANARSQFAAGHSIDINLIYDGSKNRDQGALNRIRQVVWGFNQRVGQLRLLTRNVAPELINPVSLHETNLASEEKMAGLFLASIPLLLIITAFLSSSGISADMFAGEREKRTLEALVITSCPSHAFILGKWLCAWGLTAIAITWQLLLLSLAFAVLPLSELGIRVSVSLGDWLIIWLTLLNLGALACGLQVLISLHARNFKDAQMLISLMAAIPVVTLGYTLFTPDFYSAWFNWLPILS
ncbi:MAG TPA: ABC transporter permease, partial [Cellvibrionaceae bacterium]|nr:ABC transporter permease [Cellvibrionaceae bacterium]